MKFKKYNNNPNGLKVCDCVIRAISNGLNKSWVEVYDDLCLIGRDLKTVPNDDKAYFEYLKNYEIVTPKAEKGKRRLRVEDLKKGVYIVKIANHLTSVKNGFVMDTWDCREKAVYRYWKIKGTLI